MSLEHDIEHEALNDENYDIVVADKVMSVIVFDTETNSFTEDNARIVQLAWIEYTRDGTELERKSAILQPIGFAIEQRAINIHGITNERAQQEGEPAAQVLNEFLDRLQMLAENNGVLVAHNIKYDVGRLLYECDKTLIDESGHKHDNEAFVRSMRWIDTYNLKYLRRVDQRILPSRVFGFKLAELFKKLECDDSDDVTTRAHDALADSTMAGRIYFKFLERHIVEDSDDDRPSTGSSSSANNSILAPSISSANNSILAPISSANNSILTPSSSSVNNSILAPPSDIAINSIESCPKCYEPIDIGDKTKWESVDVNGKYFDQVHLTCELSFPRRDMDV